MKNRQQGAVLAVSLILVVVASMLGVAGMGSSQLGERVAGNQRQVSEAFMAAETGISEGIAWLEGGGNTTDTRSGWTQQNRVSWTVSFSPCLNDSITISSTGFVAETERIISVNYSKQCSGTNTAPIVMLGLVETFYGATSNAFTVFGKEAKDAEGNVVYDADGNIIYDGSAIQVDEFSALKIILDDLISKGRVDNYYGGFDLINCSPEDEIAINNLLADPDSPYFGIPIACTPEKQSDEITTILEDPEKLNLFIQALKNSQNSENTGTAPDDMGTIGDCEKDQTEGCTKTIPKITLFEQTCEISKKGEKICNPLQLSGSDSGAGILIVDGNLAINGTPSFYGLIIVTGTSFTVSGGGSGGVLGGSIIFANPILDNESGEWSFGNAKAEFDFDISGGGKMTFQHDQEALDTAATLMNEEAINLWKYGTPAEESDDGSENETTDTPSDNPSGPKVSNWSSN